MQKRSEWKLLDNINKIINGKFNKRGDVWVSAVLYFGLGIVVLTLILTAGMPVVNRLKDKNIATQTKDVFATLDANIREVGRGGPGTQRILDLGLTKGDLKIYDAVNVPEDITKAKSYINSDIFSILSNDTTTQNVTNRFVWDYDMKAAISEPGMLVKEGNTKILTTGGKGSYVLRYWLDYPEVYLKMEGSNIVSGGTKLTIKNSGTNCINETKVLSTSGCDTTHLQRITIAISSLQ